MTIEPTTARKARDAARSVLTVCEVIGGIVHAGQEQFLIDVRSQWAAEMGLIRIGEAVGRIPAGVRERFPGQPWRQIIAMRNFAAHQYDDLDPRRVWRTLVQDVPALRDYLLDTLIPGLDS